MNTFPIVMLTRKLLGRFVERQKSKNLAKGGAIINLSSINALLPLAGRAMYSAGKKFDEYFTYGVDMAYYKAVDSLCVKPAFVSTPLNLHRKIDMFTTDIKTCASDSLRALGNIDRTFGAKKHIVLGFVLECVVWLLMTIPEAGRKKLTDLIAYKLLKVSRHKPEEHSQVNRADSPSKKTK
jgi:short-subunit dehydrogenase